MASSELLHTALSEQALTDHNVQSAILRAAAPGVHIGFQVRPRGPASLTGLLVNGRRLINEPVDFSNGALVIDVTKQTRGAPFTFRWAILFGADEVVAAAFLFVNGQTIEVARKSHPGGGETWVSDTFAFP